METATYTVNRTDPVDHADGLRGDWVLFVSH